MINLQQEFSDKTGNPCVLDVVGSDPEALSKYLDFTASVSDAPLMMGGISPSIRVAALDYVSESGLIDRVIYNSLTPDLKNEELEKIKETGIKSSVLLTYYMKDFASKGRVTAAKELLTKAAEAGIERPMVDTCVIDIPSLGMACKAIYEIKDELGVPVGCGAHNAVGTWRGLKTKMGKQAIDPSMAAANVLATAVGSDFILYGPIEYANHMFPTISMVDAAYGQFSWSRARRLV